MFFFLPFVPPEGSSCPDTIRRRVAPFPFFPGPFRLQRTAGDFHGLFQSPWPAHFPEGTNPLPVCLFFGTAGRVPGSTLLYFSPGRPFSGPPRFTTGECPCSFFWICVSEAKPSLLGSLRCLMPPPCEGKVRSFFPSSFLFFFFFPWTCTPALFKVTFRFSIFFFLLSSISSPPFGPLAREGSMPLPPPRRAFFRPSEWNSGLGVGGTDGWFFSLFFH